MAKLLGVVGASGTGKSTSLRNLDPRETFIIQSVPKELPFMEGEQKFTKFTGEGGNLLVTDQTSDILKMFQFINNKRPEIRVIVLDDAQYIMSNEFIKRTKEKTYEKFNDILFNIWSILNAVKNLRDDLTVVYITHDEDIIDENGEVYRKMKTIGKALDKYITLDGLFSIVLFTRVELDDNKELVYLFETRSSGNSTKTPMGLFNERYIDNDLAAVIDRINNYKK